MSFQAARVQLSRHDVFSPEYRCAIRVADGRNIALTNVTVTDTGFILSAQGNNHL